MKYNDALEEGIKETVGGIGLAAVILLSSFGITKQNTNLRS